MRNVTRTWMRMGGAAVAVAVTAMVAGPDAAAAQAAQAAQADLVGSEWAEALEDEAEALATDAGSFLEASRLYEKAAMVRQGTAEAAAAWAKAGKLAYYAGNAGLALEHLERAAETAEEVDEIFAAADAYADAAWVAMNIERKREAREFRRKAETLIRSSVLSSRDRDRLQRRFGDLG